MDDQRLRVFNAIVSFIHDLDAGFGKKYKPVALYNRLVSNTTLRDNTAMERHIEAFNTFFNSNKKYIKSQTLASTARITYSERIYLEIGKILSKTYHNAHKHIHKHLITIYSLLNVGTDEGREALETLKQTASDKSPELDLNLPDTTEGRFIKDTLTEMTQHFENIDENTNPMMMMSSMMQSGFFTKFMGDLQSKFSNGEMDLKNLMTTVTGVIGSATPQGAEDGDQIRNFITQSMGQMSALTGGQDLPPELQGQMSELLNAVGGGGNSSPNVPAITDGKDKSATDLD